MKQWQHNNEVENRRGQNQANTQIQPLQPKIKLTTQQRSERTHLISNKETKQNKNKHPARRG